MHLKEETLDSQKTYQGKIFYVTQDTARLEDGCTAIRDVVHHSGGVCVVPLTKQNTVLMVRQFRYPMQEVTLEIPAGKIEPGEDPAACGRRELLEEVGRTCETYTYLGAVYPNPYVPGAGPLGSAEPTIRCRRVFGYHRASSGRSSGTNPAKQNPGCQNTDCTFKDLRDAA